MMKTLFLVLVCAVSAQAAEKVSCEKITDDFCAKLWNKDNKGVMDVFDGKIRIGYSKKSKYREYGIEGIRTVLKASAQYPADLRARLEGALKEYEATLKVEEDTTEWSERLRRIGEDFSRAVRETNTARLKKRYPEAWNFYDDDLTVEQKVGFNATFSELEDEMTKANYEAHPNWAVAKRVFAEVKADLIAEVEELPLNSNLKKTMVERLRDAQLVMPLLSGLGRFADKDGCRQYLVNAYYNVNRNELRICAGYLYSYESPSTLAFVIGHELAHSVDSSSLSALDYRRRSPIYAILEKVRGKKSPPYSCAEWETKKKVLFDDSRTIKNQLIAPLDKLYSCLAPRDKLEKTDRSIVMAASERGSRQLLSAYATANDFTQLTQHEYSRFGEMKKNEKFLRPDLWFADSYRMEYNPRHTHYSNPVDTFNQILACKKLNGKTVPTNFLDLTLAERTSLFADSLDELRRIDRMDFFEFNQFCGLNCFGLVKEKLSADPSEAFADWLSTRAFARRLRRIKEVEHRREVTALTVARFCSEPGVAEGSPEFAEIERNFANLPHPEDRKRRISIFTKEVADLLQCERGESTNNYSNCSL